MTNTKENIIKLLKTMQEYSINMARSCEDDEVEADRCLTEANAYFTVRKMIEDEDYFNDMYDLYKDSIKDMENR